MQVVQLLGGLDGRVQMLSAVRRHLEPGGVFAAALANPFEDWSDDESLPPLPDVREENGWVYSSTPVAVRRAGAPLGRPYAGLRGQRCGRAGGQMTEASGLDVVDETRMVIRRAVVIANVVSS